MPNKVYTHPGTPYYFRASGDASFTIPSGVTVVNFSHLNGPLPSSSGLISDRLDLGPSPRATLFEWRAAVKLKVADATHTYAASKYYGWQKTFTASNINAQTVNTPEPCFAVNIYAATRDDALANDDDGARNTDAKAILTPAQRVLADAWQYVGAVREQDNPPVLPTTYVTSGLVQILSRYVSLALWNDTLESIQPSGNVIILTPMPDEVQ